MRMIDKSVKQKKHMWMACELCVKTKADIWFEADDRGTDREKSNRFHIKG